MAEFQILDHLDKLEPDGGRDSSNADRSYKCPACDADNFKVNHRTGKWDNYSCECSRAEIRNAINPAINPNGAKQQRPKQQRRWEYVTPITHERGQAALAVHRIDDGNGTRKIWQESLIDGHRAAAVKEKVLPYRLPEALKKLEAGAAHIYWVEGEPCVDRLWELGLPAVTSIGGAGKFKPERDAGHIPPERLVVVPDRDQPGVKHMEQVAAAHPGCQWLYPFPGTSQWNGSCPKSGGVDIADWIDAGATIEDIVAGIGPKLEHKPEPTHIGADEFLRDAESLKRRLDAGLEKIDAIEDVATRGIALSTLRSSLGLGKDEFAQFVRELSEAKAPKAEEDFDALMAEDDEQLEALAEDFLPAGLVLIAAEGFAGKSNTAYQIAEAVTNGSKFAGQFQCKQGAALIVQMDESKTDAKRKFSVLGLKPAKGQLTLKWHFSPMMFPELRRWVLERNARLVVLDSLMTIAGGAISPKDAEFGLLIYRLNQLAAELGITIICLHHVVKAGGKKQRTEITKDDIFGTAYVFNGASDAWGLWQSREDGNPEPVFNLRCLKSRSGLVDGGVTYQFNGCDEDKRLTYRGMAERSVSLDEINSARNRVLALLKNAKGAALDPKTVNERLKLGNEDYARRLCRELFSNPAVPVGRKEGKTTACGGRPPYLYFATGFNAPIHTSTNTETPLSAQKEDFQQSFGTQREASEREEREGIKEGFQTDYLLRARGDEDVPDWMR